MARQARAESETGLYHVMMRGNNREQIFKQEAQKQRFIEYLTTEVSGGEVQVAGWCLMDNHVHLVLNGGIINLTTALKRINIRFAMGYNTREGRIGHVFQDRYKSEPITDGVHLMAVIRYVHNNPVKAKMVKSAGDYSWSSYHGYMDSAPILDEGIRGLVLGYFDGNQKKFEAFHLEEDNEEYLEIKEDRDRYRQERAQEITADYFQRIGMTDASDLKRSPEKLEELIAELLDKGRLSYRKVAELLEVSYSRVSQASKQVYHSNCEKK